MGTTTVQNKVSTQMLRPAISMVLLAAGLSAQTAAPQFDPAIFKAPPAEYRGHAMWNFNLPTLNENAVVSGIQEMAKLNYGGFFIEAGGRPQPGQGVAFLSDEYFRLYKVALEEAKKQGLEVILYDDYAFPTGTVGGQMASQFPQYRRQEPEHGREGRHRAGERGTGDSSRHLHGRRDDEPRHVRAGGHQRPQGSRTAWSARLPKVTGR